MFRRCPNLDIPKQTQQYYFYYELYQEFENMIDALVRGSMMKLDFGWGQWNIWKDSRKSADVPNQQKSSKENDWCNDSIDCTIRSSYN